VISFYCYIREQDEYLACLKKQVKDTEEEVKDEEEESDSESSVDE
jgi:hypothetical protein